MGDTANLVFSTALWPRYKKLFIGALLKQSFFEKKKKKRKGSQVLLSLSRYKAYQLVRRRRFHTQTTRFATTHFGPGVLDYGPSRVVI